MGNQVSNIKNAAGRLTFESKKKGPKAEKTKIGILAFEVATVISKAVQLWQSLSELEIARLRSEVIKSEGVLKLVSDNENVLLGLACREKTQDLTVVALAVARLGKRCHEPALQGFEHVYNDILKQNIDVRELAFSHKEVEAKIKKMERYIGTTTNLFQELEILSEMEQALRRVQGEGDGAHKENLYALEQRAVWQRQEVKYLKDVSLWNRTYDKIVGLLARTVCTIHGRIVGVFGFPMAGWPELLSGHKNGEVNWSLPVLSSKPLYPEIMPSGSQVSPLRYMEAPCPGPGEKRCGGGIVHTNGLFVHSKGQASTALSTDGISNFSRSVVSETHQLPSLCLSPGYQSTQQKNATAVYPLKIESSLTGRFANQTDAIEASGTNSGRDQSEHPVARDSVTGISFCAPSGRLPTRRAYQNEKTTYLPVDQKSRLQNAPPSTLGGAALALHYANVIIIVEKMLQYPHLISQDARDDLYQMLPKNVRLALRARLRSSRRVCSSAKCDEAPDAKWKEAVERILNWIAPLAQNMIRWQSEHNFEQQQFVARSNVLLLQTLYFADQVKAEAAITELLVGLHYLWMQEKETRATSMEYASNKDLDEYLEWQL